MVSLIPLSASLLRRWIEMPRRISQRSSFHLVGILKFEEVEQIRILNRTPVLSVTLPALCAHLILMDVQRDLVQVDITSSESFFFPSLAHFQS